MSYNSLYIFKSSKNKMERIAEKKIFFVLKKNENVKNGKLYFLYFQQDLFIQIVTNYPNYKKWRCF